MPGTGGATVYKLDKIHTLMKFTVQEADRGQTHGVPGGARVGGKEAVCW